MYNYNAWYLLQTKHTVKSFHTIYTSLLNSPRKCVIVQHCKPLINGVTVSHDLKFVSHSITLSLVVENYKFGIAYRGVTQCDSFCTRPKKMRISQRLFIIFWTCIYDHIPCFTKSMSILVCRSLTSLRHRDNDLRLTPCLAQRCHCVVC